MKKNKIITPTILSIVLLVVTNTTAHASALENSISSETQNAINATIQNCAVDNDYYDHIIDTYYGYGYSDSEELNQILIETANSINKVYNQSNFDFQNTVTEYNSTSVRQIPVDKIVYDSAVSTFRAGAALARTAGCPHTADSMEHAIVPYASIGTGWTPSVMRYSNDSWAQTLFVRTGLWSEIEGRFQLEVLPDMPLHKIITGSYNFTSSNSSLDAYLQLHSVNYSVTFIKNPDDPYSYSSNMYISDIYDFDWSGYDNIVVGFANNYAYALQQMGALAPYQIVCSFYM